MPALSKQDKLRLLTTILESRHADLREQNLNRQGKGHFHVSGMGHEALAAISFLMEPDDYIVPYLSSCKTMLTEYACEDGRPIHWCSASLRRAIGSRSTVKMFRKFMRQRAQRWSKFAPATDQRFSG